MMWLQSHVHKKSHEDWSKKLKTFHLMKVINLRANLLFFASPLFLRLPCQISDRFLPVFMPLFNLAERLAN